MKHCTFTIILPLGGFDFSWVSLWSASSLQIIPVTLQRKISFFWKDKSCASSQFQFKVRINHSLIIQCQQHPILFRKTFTIGIWGSLFAFECLQYMHVAAIHSTICISVSSFCALPGKCNFRFATFLSYTHLSALRNPSPISCTQHFNWFEK